MYIDIQSCSLRVLVTIASRKSIESVILQNYRKSITRINNKTVFHVFSLVLDD